MTNNITSIIEHMADDYQNTNGQIMRDIIKDECAQIAGVTAAQAELLLNYPELTQF
jgi:hypothetical protein